LGVGCSGYEETPRFVGGGFLVGCLESVQTQPDYEHADTLGGVVTVGYRPECRSESQQGEHGGE
jgi:hypothetical protein